MLLASQNQQTVSTLEQIDHRSRSCYLIALPTGPRYLPYSSPTMSAPEPKQQRTDSEFELLYHPGIPGRGEFIRLMFDAAGVRFSDPANENPPNDSGPNGYALVQAISSADNDGNPPAFAPPALRHRGAGKDGKSLLIHQTPAIMSYLGGRLGLAGQNEAQNVWVNQVALTALDMNNECHDTHRQ